MSTRHGAPTRAAIASSAITALSLLAAGCTAATHGTAARPAASARARQLHRLFPGLHVSYGGVAGLTGATPPASGALPGANDLLAAGPGNGQPVLAATDLGVFRSTDGGVTWNRVLGGISAWSLTAAARGGYAALGNLPGRPNFGPAVLATSADGVHWRVHRVRAPRSGTAIPLGAGYRIAMSGIGPHATAIAVSDISWALYAGHALRSTDGGRTWTRISKTLPSWFSTPVLADGGRIAYLTAPGPGRDCAGAVYRSANAGATWSLLRSSCQPYPLMAVQFISASQGFAAGGLSYKAGGGQVAEATSDGGRTWHTTLRTTGSPGGGTQAGSAIISLDMVSARSGWALAGGCEIGQNGPCASAVLVTSDGGYQWRATGQSATSVLGLGAAGQLALAGDDQSAAMASTSDGGRDWTLRTPPRWIATSAFSGSGSSQVRVTNLGDFLSADAGSAWVSAGQLRTARYAYESWLAGAGGRLLGYTESMKVITSDDGGQTFGTSTVPDGNANDMLLATALGTGGSAIAITGAIAQCLNQAQVRRTQKLKPGWQPSSAASRLFTSADGGAHWSAGSALPFGVSGPAPAMVDGSLVAIIDACNRVQVSTDGGLRWHAEAIAKTVFCVVSGLGRELWLSCQSGAGGFWVLHSADSGVTWTAYWLRASAAIDGMSLAGPGPMPVINPGGVFPTGPGGAVMPAGGSLWRTADGGRAWRQSWPAL